MYFPHTAPDTSTKPAATAGHGHAADGVAPKSELWELVKALVPLIAIYGTIGWIFSLIAGN